MASTSFDPLAARLRTRRATGYEPRFLSDDLELAPSDRTVFGAEGGLWSCVEDLARWLGCQVSEEPGIVARQTLDEMHRPRYLTDEEWTRAWCIGWYARRREDAVWIMHTGGYYGFTTAACFDRKTKVGAIALVNGIGEAAELALRIGTLAREAVNDAAPELDVPAELPAAWRPYVGLYTAPHFGTVIRVEWRDGKLTVLDAESPAWTPTLVPTDETDVFLIEPGFRESGELARFERAPDGRVVSMHFAVAGMLRLEPVAL
jgi:CubicO group peptidase (beta-lactamase class C family)